MSYDRRINKNLIIAASIITIVIITIAVSSLSSLTTTQTQNMPAITQNVTTAQNAIVTQPQGPNKAPFERVIIKNKTGIYEFIYDNATDSVITKKITDDEYYYEKKQRQDASINQFYESVYDEKNNTFSERKLSPDEIRNMSRY